MKKETLKKAEKLSKMIADLKEKLSDIQPAADGQPHQLKMHNRHVYLSRENSEIALILEERALTDQIKKLEQEFEEL